ncbi:MAG: FAD-dependent monooxygenase, partial [Devosia sp.]
ITGHRAGGLHARTLELFDQRGIADRFVAEGQKAQAAGFAGVMFDLSDFPSRFPFTLGLWQIHVERILAGWVAELGVPIYRGAEVVGVTQTDSGVDVALGDGRSFHARYLVGCDGGRSAVRKLAGIAFPGTAPTTSNIIAEVEMTTIPEFGVHRTALGIHSFGRADYKIVDGKIVYADHGPIGVLVTEAQVAEGEPTLDDLRAALIAACGTDHGVHSPHSISRFTDATRQAANYRKGRVLVAGDAAHIHPPDGGQGLQTGVGDAVNLGWKLAHVLSGTSPAELLDTYHSERHPIAARVLRHTLASVALRKDDDRSKALRETMAGLLGMDEPRRSFAGMLSGLGIHYDLGVGHPLLGRRMPDLDLTNASGAVRVYDLLHSARPVLLNLAAPGSVNIAPWANRVQLVDATATGPWLLPVIGLVSTPSAVLIRPDGYVAWVGEGTDAGLVEALTAWFGPPA